MNLHVKRSGSGEKILFIHGAGGSTRSWYLQKEYLKGIMEVILVDLPGHGESPGAGFATIEEGGNAIYETIKTLGIEKCYVVGHSMGGAMALSLALAHGEILKGVILIGTGAKLGVFPEILEGILKDKEGTVRKILDVAFSRRTPVAVKEIGFAEMMKCEKEVIHRNFDACNRFDVRGRLGKIDVPVQIICGIEDLMTPPKYSEYLQKEIKGSKFTLIEGAGHMVMIERPDEVNRAIADFVRGH